ncbi:MAG: helix-turn-helix transcriptional regulator [Clostridia bacterium]|nr:helix-turn-helix transcriptional regulator [Clostridia bacterium]
MTDINLLYYRHNRYALAPKISSRKIFYYELTVMLDGQMEYRINSQPVLLEPGDLLFLRYGDLRARDLGRGKADYVSFNFQCDEDFGLETVIENGISREISHLIAACDELARMPKGECERRIGYVLSCILHLIQEKPKEVYSNLTEGIIRYIHSHLTEKIILSEIGRQMHFSPVYCDTVFKKEVGKSIVSYLLDVRLEEAKSLLLANTESVRDISRAVGIEDHNYFSRLFKQRMGYTPTQYRNSILKNYKNEK